MELKQQTQQTKEQIEVPTGEYKVEDKTFTPEMATGLSNLITAVITLTTIIKIARMLRQKEEQ